MIVAVVELSKCKTDQILLSQPRNSVVVFTSVWLGKRKRKLRCSGQNLQLRITFKEETCKEELRSGTVA
jgi:hypothetical protein